MFWLTTQRAVRTFRGWGRMSWGIWVIFKVQLAVLLHLNHGEGKACPHQAASMEVKGKPFLGDNYLNLGPLRCWVASQQIMYGFFLKPILTGFLKTVPKLLSQKANMNSLFQMWRLNTTLILFSLSLRKTERVLVSVKALCCYLSA